MTEDDTMEFDSFQQLVSELKRTKPVWFGLESDPPANESELDAAEVRLGVRLPDKYRAFVKEFGGGYFAFGNVFSVDKESDWNIVARNEGAQANGFVAISDNGTGDRYGFRINGEACEDRIYFWDHEEPNGVSPTDFDDLLEFLRSDALKQD